MRRIFAVCAVSLFGCGIGRFAMAAPEWPKRIVVIESDVSGHAPDLADSVAAGLRRQGIDAVVEPARLARERADSGDRTRDDAIAYEVGADAVLRLDITPMSDTAEAVDVRTLLTTPASGIGLMMVPQDMQAVLRRPTFEVPSRLRQLAVAQLNYDWSSHLWLRNMVRVRTVATLRRAGEPEPVDRFTVERGSDDLRDPWVVPLHPLPSWEQAAGVPEWSKSLAADVQSVVAGALPSATLRVVSGNPRVRSERAPLTRVGPTTVTLDAGGRNGLQPGDRLVLFREANVPGDPAGVEDRYLGEAKVVDVSPEGAVARITSARPGFTPRAGDLARRSPRRR